MSLLNGLGLASLVFVISFTSWASRDDGTPAGRQSSRQAIIEVWIGMGIGFSLNWVMNWLLLPLVGAHFSAAENLALGMIYTSVSIVRGYVVRRWAESRIRRFAARAAERFATPEEKHIVSSKTQGNS